MYSTKTFHPKKLPDTSLYNTINEPYVDKQVLPERWKGKRLNCGGGGGGGKQDIFDKTAYPDPYIEAELYIKSQPLDTRKKGFGSKDASKRGEFSSFIRTEQYRETLRKELLLLDKQKTDPTKSAAAPAPKKKSPAAPTSFVYDMRRGRKQPPSSRHHQQHNGPSPSSLCYRLSSSDIGEGVWSAKLSAPQHGPVSCVKSFFDKSHLHVSNNSAGGGV